MRVGGKPPPPSRYHTGTVNGHEWDSVVRTWRVHLALDPAYLGVRMKPMLLVTINLKGIVFVTEVNGDVDEELDTTGCAVRQFWRNIDPAAG
jgi:hypothetical protein